MARTSEQLTPAEILVVSNIASTGYMLPCVDKSTNFTAVLGGHYNVTATLTITDPSPINGAGFTVFVRNGTATIGGTAYTVPGTEVCRVFHSGSWSNFVKYPVTGGEGTATWVLTSNGAGTAPSFQAASGGFLEKEIGCDEGPAIVGPIGSYTSTRTGTLVSIRLVSDTLPVGSNCIAEFRKNSTTSGNILSATLQITTAESATNGQYIGTAVTSFSSSAIAAGDVFYVYLTGVGSTTPASNVRALIYTT